MIRQCSKLAQIQYKTRPNMGWKGDTLGTVQEIEIWTFYQIAYAQTIIHPREWGA